MRISSQILTLFLITSFVQSILFQPEMSYGAGVPCETLIRLDDKALELLEKGKKVVQKTVDIGKVPFQAVRPGRIPVIGRFEKYMSKATALYENLGKETPEAQQEWMKKFRERIDLRQPTEPEESLVYMRLLNPDQGGKIWEMMTGANLIVARKRLALNPFGLIEKFRRTENPALTEDERYYLSEVKVKSEYLFLNKLTWPDRIADLDYHLLSLATTAQQIGSRKGNPMKAIYDFAKTFRDPRFMKELYGQMLYLIYSDETNPSKADAIKLLPMKEAVTNFWKEVEREPVNQKTNLLEFEKEFINDINDPSKISTELDKTITPAERDAWSRPGPDGGALGLLNQMRNDRGTWEGTKRFKHFVIASAAFRATLLMISVGIFGYFIWQHMKNGTVKQTLKQLDPNAPEPPPTEEENQNQIIQYFIDGQFNPYELKGLFDDKADPTDPSAPTCPCDPEHVIRNAYGKIKSQYAGPHDLQEKNLDFIMWTNGELLKNTPTRDSPCIKRFIKAWESSYPVKK